MKKSKLSNDEKAFINNIEKNVSFLLEELEKVRQFKEGDYLVLSEIDEYSKRTIVLKNSYNVVRKFQVVHVDSNGIPFCKEVNSKNNTVGGMLCCLNQNKNNKRYFEVDPDYAESIILGDNNFDPTASTKQLSSVFKDVSTFNKKIKIESSNHKALRKYIQTLKVGDSFWTSNSTQYLIQDIKPLPVDGSNRVKESEHFIFCKNNKGKEVKFAFWNLLYKNIYTTRPRSYSELKS